MGEARAGGSPWGATRAGKASGDGEESRFGPAGATLVLALSVLNSLDAALTSFFVRNGQATEANPVMGALLGASPLLFVLVKLVIVNLGGWALWRMRRHRAARGALRGCVFLYAAVVAYHLAFVAAALAGRG